MKAIPICPLAALMLAAACGGDSGSPTGPLSLRPRNFIEALFLSDGPLSDGPPSGFMSGFRARIKGCVKREATYLSLRS